MKDAILTVYIVINMPIMFAVQIVMTVTMWRLIRDQPTRFEKAFPWLLGLSLASVVTGLVAEWVTQTDVDRFLILSVTISIGLLVFRALLSLYEWLNNKWRNHATTDNES